MNQSVYVFDVDGVINDLQTYKVDNRVLKQICKLLNKGFYVAINTGRGYAWVEEDVIDYLKKQLKSNDRLDHIFISTEMGGLVVKFTGGVENREKTAFSLLPDQIGRVKQLYEQHKVENVMGWYPGKLSMATLYKLPGTDPNHFLDKGRPLAEALVKEFEGEHVKIKHNPDAIDVTTPEAGKWAGAQLIYSWLQQTPASQITHFICFGDNASDYEMARFYGQKGHTVDFVFTGENAGDIEHDNNVNFIKTPDLYNHGTYKFLRDHLQS